MAKLLGKCARLAINNNNHRNSYIPYFGNTVFLNLCYPYEEYIIKINN